MANKKLIYNAEKINEILQKSNEDYTKSEIDDLIASGASMEDIEKLKNDISSIQNEQATQNERIEELTTLTSEGRAALAEIVDSGAKNLIIPDSANVGSTTAVINADKSVTVTCNTSSITTISIAQDLSRLIDGKKYVISGCVGGNYAQTYGIAIRTSNGAELVFQYDKPVEFTKTSEMVKCELSIRSGQTWTKTFYPMICTAVAYKISDKFVPYRPSLEELAERVAALEGGT